MINKPITPDGFYYLAMGAGQRVPRPYAGRMLPRIVKPTWEAWHVLAIVSMCLSFAAIFMIGGFWLACAVHALPAWRVAVARPVVLDAPMLAVSALAALAVTHGLLLLALLYIVLSVFIHERAPSVAAAYVMAVEPSYCTVALSAAFVATVASYVYTKYFFEPHPDETTVSWLRSPFAAAMATHRNTSIAQWLVGMGSSLVALVWFDYVMALILGIGYAPCLVAQDRGRLYSVVAPALLIIASQHLEPVMMAIAAIINLLSLHTGDA